LEIKRPLLVLQVPENNIADIVSSHDIPMHILPAVLTRAVKATDAFCLGHKAFARRALLAGIVLVDTDYYVAEGSRLMK
jgi:hypothetical protein